MAKKNEKLSRSEAGKARWAALSPAEKAKVKARLAKGRQARASGQPAAPKTPKPARANPRANAPAPERAPAGGAKGIALPTTPRGHFVLVRRDGNRGTSCEVFAKRADAEAAAGRCRAGVVLQVDSNWA